MISKLCNWIAKIPHDKLLHFIIVYLITDFVLSISHVVNYTPTIATAVITVFIFLKEHIDEYKYNGFSWLDVLAGYIGYITKIIIFIIANL